MPVILHQLRWWYEMVKIKDFKSRNLVIYPMQEEFEKFENTEVGKNNKKLLKDLELNISCLICNSDKKHKIENMKPNDMEPIFYDVVTTCKNCNNKIIAILEEEHV